MSEDALFQALAQSSVTGVEGALRKLDHDDTRVGASLWAALDERPRAVALQTAAWRFMAQAPAGSFSAADLNTFFQTLSGARVDRIAPAEGRVPWDVTFDAMIEKVRDDRDIARLDDGVAPPMRAAVRVALVRHGIAAAEEWGDETPREWLETLLPLWDRYPGYADEFVRLWSVERRGHLAVKVAADPETELRTTEFLRTFAPFAHPEERLRIVLNVAAPEAMESALAVLEQDHRDNLAVIFGNERRWYERIFEEFGSPVFGPHGIIGGPGIVGLVIGFALFRLVELRFALFVLVVAATFFVWRLALSLSVRPLLPWTECRPLASGPGSLGLVAGWIVYRRSLAKRPYDASLIGDFVAGLVHDFPELGRPSRLRTVIEVNLAQLEPRERVERVLEIFGADDAIERWGILGFCPTVEVARAAIAATARFETDDPTVIAAAPPLAQEALSVLAAHHQDLFLSALDDGVGSEEVLVFAIGHARGDGVLDSLGRKLGEGSDAMREAVVTALSNYGPAATPGVERALGSTQVGSRRDAAEVAWRLTPSRGLVAAIRSALATEADRDVARLLRCALIQQELSHATADVDPNDLLGFATALDGGLARLADEAVEFDRLVPHGMRWIAGPEMTAEAAFGLGFVIEAFEGEDARLLTMLTSIADHLELGDRDDLAHRLYESDVDILAAIAIAGPAATFGLEASTDTIEALARMSTPAALIRLEGIAHDDPDPGLRRRAFRRFYQSAEARKIAVADLFEHAVLDLPPEATIDPTVARTVEAQATRVLHEAMVSGHRWRMEEWRKLWADSPLFANLVGRLVWAIYDYGLLRSTFRLDEGGDPVDVDDEPVALEPFTEIGLPVPSALDRPLGRAWSLTFADYEILAPFPQLDRPTAPRSVAALELDGASLRALLSDGWYPSTPGLERHYGFLRPFPRLRITASLEISPGVGLDDDEPQQVDTLAFVDGIHSEFPSISRLSPEVPDEARIQVLEELWNAASGKA